MAGGHLKHHEVTVTVTSQTKVTPRGNRGKYLGAKSLASMYEWSARSRRQKLKF